MKPEAYESFRKSVQKRLKATRGGGADALRLHDAQVKELETSRRNLILMARQGMDSQSLVEELNQIDLDLARMEAGREKNVPPEIELPDNLPELYREMVSNLAAPLSDESVAGRAAD